MPNDDFVDSPLLIWTGLDIQAEGSMNWDNAGFKSQHAVHASAGYIGPLASPGGVGFIADY